MVYQSLPMKTSVSQAKGQLTELVKLAEAGEEVVLTRFGRDVVRLVPLKTIPSSAERRALMERARAIWPQACETGTVGGAQPGLPLRRRDRLAEMIVIDTSALMAIILDEPDG